MIMQKFKHSVCTFSETYLWHKSRPACITAQYEAL